MCSMSQLRNVGNTPHQIHGTVETMDQNMVDRLNLLETIYVVAIDGTEYGLYRVGVRDSTIEGNLPVITLHKLIM